MALVFATRLEAESLVKGGDLKKLAGRNLELFGQAAQILFREVSLLVLERVKDGDNLLRIPAITFKDTF
jgi:hypothetical protein